MKENNEGFSSILGFIMVAIGLALGIGSLWRFPYVVGENGGAIFIFMYIAIILIIGIPLMTAEVTIGFKTQRTAIDAYKTLSPKTKWYYAGYLHTLAAILIVGYTAPIYAWILKYISLSVTGGFTGLDKDMIVSLFNDFNADKNMVYIFFMINLVLNAIVIIFGIQNGIERLSKILMPILFAIMAVIIFYAISLDTSGEGLRFLFTPDPSKFSIKSVITCLGQAFFALGLAMLGSMVFGSYIKQKDENIFKTSTIICSALVLAGIFAGMMILPIVFATGLTPEEGVSLTFLTLPNAFNVIPYGNVLAILFYFGFYIAAFTSSVGVLEAITGQFSEKFNMSRKKALLIAFIIVAAIAYVSVNNDAFFNFVDNVESNYILVIGVLLIAIFTGYVWGIEEAMDAANIKNKLIRTWMKVSIKYISPVVIVIIFLSQFIKF